MKYQISNQQLLKFEKREKEICLEWKYDGPLFSKARLNIGINPQVVPWLWHYWIDNSDVPDLDSLANLLRKDPKHSVSGNFTKYSDENIHHARCYQFRLGFLRELDLAIRIIKNRPKAEIWRDDEEDTGSGRSDITYINEGVKKRFAVTHKGETSDFYAEKRKYGKQEEDVIVIVADWRFGEMDLVSEGVLQKLL